MQQVFRWNLGKLPMAIQF